MRGNIKQFPNEEYIFTWKGIADEMGVTREDLCRWLKKANIRLLRKNPKLKHSIVLIPKQYIPLLFSRLIESKTIKHNDTIQKICNTLSLKGYNYSP